ncbi:hypothetical protein Ahy_B07g088832 [Arachis hypogaea]|uniref:Uncharacterized protein n=1 Tax=Arachis hypogaea TaxID=3818 RepID=A0A444YFN6_ARAHY|nr:hypothetical protein Ahy_B07g088832 [Arachis hypogaea]
MAETESTKTSNVAIVSLYSNYLRNRLRAFYPFHPSNLLRFLSNLAAHFRSIHHRQCIPLPLPSNFRDSSMIIKESRVHGVLEDIREHVLLNLHSIEKNLQFWQSKSETFNVFDFLKDILNKVPDLGGSGATGDDRSIPKKRKIAEDDDNDSDEEQKRNKMLEARNTSGRGRSRGRGRGRGRGHRTADHDYEMISHVKFEDESDVLKQNGKHTQQKHCVQTFNVFDFLKDILNKVPDLGGSGATGDDRSIPKKRKIAEDDDNDSDEEQKRNKMLEARNTSGRGRSRGRGRGRGRGHRTADHDYEMISHVKFEDESDVLKQNGKHTQQ